MSVQSVVRRLTTPPVFSDPEKTATARVLYQTALAVIVVATPLTLALVVFVPAAAMRWVIVVTGIDLGCLLMLVLTRRGHVTAAAWSCILVAWAVVTASVTTAGGVSAPGITSQLVLVVFAGMLIGWQGGVVMGALAVATVSALAIAETAGLLPPLTIHHTPYSRALVLTTYICVLTALQAIIMVNLRNTRDAVMTQLAEREMAERRLADVIDSAPIGAVVFELHPDGALALAGANPEAERIVGVDRVRDLGVGVAAVFPHARDHDIERAVLEVFRTGVGFRDEVAYAPLGQRESCLEVHALQVSDSRVAVFFRDVTETKSTEEQMRHLAYHDALTQLPNRKLLTDLLTSALANANRRGGHVGVIFIDLDNFKEINDRHGHALGDKILVAVARRFQDAVRAGDAVARFGGDEFVVLLPEVDGLPSVVAAAEKLIEAAREPYEVAGETFNVRASLGVTMSSGAARDAAQLVSQADSAMYEMKDQGRDGIRVYEAG